jgi:hypothetical protein
LPKLGESFRHYLPVLGPHFGSRICHRNQVKPLQMAMTDNPDILLTRAKAAAALTEAGYPTARATLASMATRGGGPIYRRFGSRVVYRWGDLLDWARSRLSAPIRSTSGADAG